MLAALAADELLDDMAALEELLDDAALEELLLEDTMAGADETLDAIELGVEDTLDDEDDVTFAGTEELLARILVADELADDACEPLSTAAAAVWTNTDFIADQFPASSPALTPYK